VLLPARRNVSRCSRLRGVSSPAARQRAATVPGRGYYLLIEFQKNHETNNTPSTPPSRHLRLGQQTGGHFSEGIDARFARHQTMAGMVRGWAQRNGSSCSARRVDP